MGQTPKYSCFRCFRFLYLHQTYKTYLTIPSRVKIPAQNAPAMVF